MSQPIEAYFEEHQVSGDLAQQAVRGGVISIAMQYGSGAFQIIGAIVLARLLLSERWSRSLGLGLLAAAASVVLISVGSGAS